MPRTDDFQNALNLARDRLLSLDPAEICRNAGALWLAMKDGNKMILPFFNREISITYPDVRVCYEEGEGNLSLQEQGMILHYLIGVKDIPPTGQWITFREIPSGEFYYQPFLKRAQVPLVATFGSNHELFKKMAIKMGGKAAEMGDSSVKFLPFPRVPVTLILWKGDEEFEPDGNILFDSTIKHFLTGEDVAVLAGSLVYKMIALSKGGF